MIYIYIDVWKIYIYIYNIYVYLFTPCVSVSASAFIKGHILPSTWLHTKIHVYVVSAAFWKGNSRRNFKCDLLQQNHARHRSYRQIHPPLKKCHLYTRGQVDFKNVIPMLHGKHKKKCFLRSMGSTFLIFSTPPQRNSHFLGGKITAEGCQKWQIVIRTLREKQK